VTHGTLRSEIPVLDPDDDLIDRLARLAAASRPTRGGVVVPVAFSGPTARALSAAAAVAALTAGTAVAAAQLATPQHSSPTPPITSVGTPNGSVSPHGHHRPLSSADRTESQHPSDQASPAADPQTTPAPSVNQPTGDNEGNDQDGNDQDGNDQDGNDQDGNAGDVNGDTSGDGVSDGGDGDGGTASSGTSGGGNQDGGGTQDGSGDGSGTSPGDDAPAALIGRGD
jgi:hypothetical protein